MPEPRLIVFSGIDGKLSKTNSESVLAHKKGL